jgi:hypothetical protein
MRRAAVVLAALVAALATGIPGAQAITQAPRHNVLPQHTVEPAPQHNALPVLVEVVPGCSAAKPTISETTLLVDGIAVPATQVRTSGITCTAASGVVVSSTRLTVQEFLPEGVWGEIRAFLPQPAIGPARLIDPCWLSGNQCSTGVGDYERRGVMAYYLTKGGVGITVRLYSAVQAPLA